MRNHCVLYPSTTTSEMAARLAVPLLCWIGAMLAHQVAPALIQRDAGTDSILASTGAIITALPHVPYEDALVVQFRYTLPAFIQNVSEIPAEDAAICPLDAAPLCVWEQQLYAATDSLRKAITPATGNVSELQATRQPMLELATYLQTLSTRTSRQKRALWSIIGSAIPLVAEYFPKLISLFKSSPAPHMEQNAILPMEVPLAQSPKGLTGQLLKFKDDFVKFKSMFRQQAATSNNQVDFSAKNAALQLAMNAMFEINTIDQSAEICREHLLPPRLVRLKHLKNAINQARQRVQKFGAELVIPDSNLTAYYKVKSATCTFSGNHFIITFRLPVKKTGETLTLFRLHPAPFKIHDVVCYLFTEPLTLALINDKPYFLPASFCPDYEFFCELPRDKNPSDIEPCLHPFFNYKMSVAACEPACSRSDKPIVTQAANSDFWVVTDDQFPLTIDCPQQLISALPDLTVGAYSINLPCSCALTYGSDVLVAPHLLCDQHPVSDIRVATYVPIQWTKRAAPPFWDMARRPTPLLPADIIVDQEEEVEVRGEPHDLPRWVIETLAAVCGAVIAAALGLLRRVPCLRRCWRRARAQPVDLQLDPLAGPTPQSTPQQPRRAVPALPPAVVGSIPPRCEHSRSHRRDGMDASVFAKTHRKQS